MLLWTLRCMYIFKFMFMRFVLFFTSVLRSGIAGSYGSSSFHFVKNLIFYRAIPIYIPTNTVNVFFFFSHPWQYLVFVFFLMIAILTGVRYYLIVYLISISLMISDVVYISMCLLAICISSWENVYSVLLPTF